MSLREPYRLVHEASVQRKAERAAQLPKSLEGRIAWYIRALSDELPDRLHKGEVWKDRVSLHELQNGVKPTGGSALGAPAYSGSMRLLLEATASITDEDDAYLFPIRAALERMLRNGHRARVNNLRMLAGREGDWQGLAASKGWDDEEMHDYLMPVLKCLWFEYRDEARARAA